MSRFVRRVKRLELITGSPGRHCHVDDTRQRLETMQLHGTLAGDEQGRAPSQIWLALPAVMTPPGEIGSSLPRASAEASSRTPSSRSCRISEPSASVTRTGMISFAKAFALIAAAACR